MSYVYQEENACHMPRSMHGLVPVSDAPLDTREGGYMHVI